MAVGFRPTPIDPLHERDISLSLARHHDDMAAVTTGEQQEDHLRAAQGCRSKAEEWQAKADAPAKRPTRVAPPQAAQPPASPLKAKPATPTRPLPPPGGQGSLL